MRGSVRVSLPAATTELCAHVFDVQRFSVHDGPGIRTTVFLKGCPLQCAWCQNPESQESAPQLMLHEDLCIGCGACLEACPEMDGTHLNGRAPRPATCRVCGRCVDVCPTGARKLAGQERSVDEVLELALRDRPFYGQRGGVTLSGGEPLAQWPFARHLADRLRSAAVHVALDTACVATPDVIRQVPDHVDLVLADLKLVPPEGHRFWTGVDNAGILAAIHWWSAAMPGRLWISVPVIPGVQDEAEFERIAAFCGTLDNEPPIRLIPYHRLGDSKYEALGRPAPAFPGSVDEQMDKARTSFIRRGIHILEQG
jgi:pyruvate formate lyase activating enzyme